MTDRDVPPTDEKTTAFLRYIAVVASRVTAGESDPAQINWSYIRDQAFLAIQRDS